MVEEQIGFLAALHGERRRLRSVGYAVPTEKDVREVAEAVRKQFGSGIMERLAAKAVKGDDEWAMAMLSHVFASNGGVIGISRDEFHRQLSRSGEAKKREAPMNEVIVKHVVEVKGMDELLKALGIVADKLGNPVVAVSAPAAAPANPMQAVDIGTAIIPPQAEPAKERKPRAPKPAPVAAPAPAAEPEKNEDDGFGEPAAPAAPEKKYTLEEVRAECLSADARLKKEVGADKWTNPGPRGNFLLKLWPISGQVPGTGCTIDKIKPETFAAVVTYCQSVKAKDVM